MIDIISDTLLEMSEKIVDENAAITSITCPPGLIFLKYLCWLADKQPAIIAEDESFKKSVIREFLNKKKPGNVFIPREARIEYLSHFVGKVGLGIKINEALQLIDGLNFFNRGITPKYYETSGIQQKHLGNLIKNLADIPNEYANTGDILIHAYDQIVRKLLKNSDNINYTPIYPRSLYTLMVHLLEPSGGMILDPCCQMGDSIIEAAAFMKEKNPSHFGAAFYGQVVTLPLWHLCCMNLEMHDIRSGGIWWDFDYAIFHDKLKELKFETIFCSPPNDGKTANWLQYVLSHLSKNGKAALLLPRDTLVTRENTIQDIREELIRSNVLDAVILLPSNIVKVPLCIWIIDLKRRENTGLTRRRENELLLIDYSWMTYQGEPQDYELTDRDIEMLSQGYRAWIRRKLTAEEYKGNDIINIIPLPDLEFASLVESTIRGNKLRRR